MKPEFVKVGDKKYKINTDFRIAIECDEITRNDKIGEYEKALAIIFKLFGTDGLNDKINHDKLLELGLKYLMCGKEIDDTDVEEPNMDYLEDVGYIKASFLSDYGIKDIWSVKYMHWWDFIDYLTGLTEDSMLERVRYIRAYELTDLDKQDSKTVKEWEKRKKSVALKRKNKVLSQEEENKIAKFMDRAKIK